VSTTTPLPVPEILRPWIRAVTVLTAESAADRAPLVHLPDTATALIVRTAAAGPADLLVAGPRTRAGYYRGKDFPLCLRLRLRPGAGRLILGVPVRDLTDRIVRVADLWDADVTPRGQSSDPARLLRQLGTLIVGRIEAHSAADRARADLARQAAHALAGRPGQPRQPVPSVARRLAVSERHLRNLFTDRIGTSPKRYERLTRVRAVLAHGSHGRRWSTLAAETGYYDQSHMIAEFRDVMGVTPAAYFAGRLPAPQPC